MLIMKNSCFIHFPKTGGTWVKKALLQAGVEYEEYLANGNSHAGVRECPCPEKFKFGFVRHPLSFYKSYWQFKMTDGWDEQNVFDMAFKNDDFCSFVRDVTNRRPGVYGSSIADTLGEGMHAVDFIGKTENLVEDLITALRMGGEKFDEKKLRETAACNVSDKVKFPAEYTEELRRRVLLLESPMMRKFDYYDTPPQVVPEKVKSASKRNSLFGFVFS